MTETTPTTESPMTETSSGTQEDSSMAEIVVTVDHVYLPLDEAGDVGADWAVTSVSTTRVSRGTRLKVPTDLALLLLERKQAEIL